MAVVSAPTYLARRVPQTPYDLDAYNCIAFNFAPRRRAVFRR
jgi:hypothetical protein